MKAPSHRVSTALVLSGGGVRGAYEAGVVAGIIDVLGLKANAPSPFSVLAGTSVGAINAAFLAAHSDRGDMAIADLEAMWTSLRIERHLRVTPLTMLRHKPWGEHAEYYGRSLLDPRPLEDLVKHGIPWDRLHANVQAQHVDALMLAALRISTGRTVIFVEQAPGNVYRPSLDPRRLSHVGVLSAEHVLGSAAIPLVFPARRIGNTYYCDGGLRFNTPMAPAIRAGAERLVVISVKYQPTLSKVHAPYYVDHDSQEEYPSWTFLAGKVLDALLLDPVHYDLQVLDRFNRLFEVLNENVPPQAMAKVEHVLVETRGNAYRQIKTLVFHPSQDIGVLAGNHVRSHINLWNVGVLGKWFLGRAGRQQDREADWASYLLFDGAFTQKLIDLGRNDAVARATEIRQFFAT